MYSVYGLAPCSVDRWSSLICLFNLVLLVSSTLASKSRAHSAPLRVSFAFVRRLSLLHHAHFQWSI